MDQSFEVYIKLEEIHVKVVESKENNERLSDKEYLGLNLKGRLRFIQKSFHKKEKSPIIFFECKKPWHFESKCPDLENSKDKKNKFFKSKKKSLMSTWEDLDNSSSNEDNKEEANMCLMVGASTGKAEPTLDMSCDDEDPQPDDTINFDGEEVIFESREDLIKGYNQLLSTSARISKAYRKLNKHFQHLEREHEDLKKVHQVNLVDFVLETTPPSIVQDASICEEVKALLDEKTGCQHYKQMPSNLNYKLKGCEVLKELPPEILKLCERIETLRDKLGKFVGGHEALNKIIKVQRNPKYKSCHGLKGKKIVHSEKVIVCYLCGKVGHETHKFKDLPVKCNPSKGPSIA
ncbi:hypothetical protein GmHk_18G051097 [Glycine max]|nr:hypothetical protein GmHk_18G051097 [Glycine max]